MDLYPDALLEKDNRGNLPIHIQQGDWDKKLIELFYKVQPKCISTPNREGRLPLHLVAAEKFMMREGEELTTLLLELYPDGVRHRDNNGDLPIDLAVIGNQEVVKILLDRYPNSIDECSDDGTYLLHAACACEPHFNSNAVLCILKARPEHASKPSASTKMLPLHYACKNHPTSVIKALVEAHPDALRLRDAKGNLPAHFAAGNQRFNTLEYLFSQYPEAFLHKNKHGELPIDCCAKDDSTFLELARLCPESLFRINETNIQDSALLSPLVQYLVSKQNLPKCRADMVRQVFHHVFQCLLAKMTQIVSGKDEEVENKKLRRERDEALHDKEKLEGRWKAVLIENRNLKEQLQEQRT